MSKSMKKALLLMLIIVALGFSGVLTDGLLFLGQWFCVLFPDTPSLEIMNYFESPYLVAGVMAIFFMAIGLWLGKKIIKLICLLGGIAVIIGILASLGIVVF